MVARRVKTGHGGRLLQTRERCKDCGSHLDAYAKGHFYGLCASCYSKDWLRWFYGDGETNLYAEAKMVP